MHRVRLFYSSSSLNLMGVFIHYYYKKRLSDAREGVRKLCGDEVADKIKPLWGLNEEGEINGCFRDLGYQGLWYIMGELKPWFELNK